MKKFIKSILFPNRLKLFYKIHAIYHFFKIKYPRIRSIQEYDIAKQFIKYQQQCTLEKWQSLNKHLAANLDQNSKKVINDYKEKVDYIMSHNLINQNELFSAKEQKEQKICSQKLKKIAKKLNKYNFSSLSPETFYGYNGIKWLPKKQQEKIKDGICIDGGAFEGDTAIMLINNFQIKEIHSFEIDPNNYKRLLETIKISQSNKIKAKFIGLSDHEGSGSVITNGASSLLIAPTENPDIKITKLDDLYSPIEKISLIKLDVEGMEQNVLKGAEAIIKRDKPILAISIYHSADDFLNIKPLIESMQPGYKFIVEKISPFTILTEVMLIAYYE